jgi:hypothetical protein
MINTAQRLLRFLALIQNGGEAEGRRTPSPMEGGMHIKMNKPMKYALLATTALSLLSAVTISVWPETALARCRLDAGLGNGSSLGDPGSSGAHNQAGNAPALPGSAAAQGDGLHEIDDPDEPN